ncbi:50S ribosomal protein L11 methyltransferase [Thermodesulfobacteriota bacterium]
MSRAEDEWVEVMISLPEEMVDGVSNFCHEHEAAGVALVPAESGATSVVAYFGKEEWSHLHERLSLYLGQLTRIFPDCTQPELTTAPLMNENWAVMWQSHFKPHPVGKTLLITPPWENPDSAGRHVIVIEPAEAFGTGTHETTQGCLVLLEEIAERLGYSAPDSDMLDVGCGSGILAIAAVKLGIGKVLAVDNDPLAIEATGKNAVLNGVEDSIHSTCRPLEHATGTWNIVTANLDTLTLKANKVRLIELFKEHLIVSGVPLEYWDSVKGEFSAARLELRREITGSEWACGRFEKVLH